MFQKEHSAEGTATRGGVAGGTAAKDIPISKKDRKQLCHRAKSYFCRTFEASNNNNDGGDGHDDDNASTVAIEGTLDNIFLRGGTIFSRHLPASDFPNLMANNNSTTTSTKNTNRTQHHHVVLYLKDPTAEEPTSATVSTSTSHKDNAGGGGGVAASAAAGGNNSITVDWPYSSTHYNQCVWIALEDKKNGAVLAETPSVALWAVMFPLVHNYAQRYVVEIPSEASKYLCRGADLMRAGMRSIPDIAVASTTTIDNNGPVGSRKGNNNGSKKQGKNNKQGPKNQDLPPMVAICVRGNPQPFAVGRSLVDNTSMDNVGVGAKGVGVEIWNCYGDDIWRLCRPGQQELLHLEKQNKFLRRNTHGQVQDVHVSSAGNVVTAASAATNLSKGISSTAPLPYDNGHFGNAGFLDGQLVVPIIRIHRDGGKDQEEDDVSNEEDGNENTSEAVSDIEDAVDDSKDESPCPNLSRVDDVEIQTLSIGEDDEETGEVNDGEGEAELSPDDVLHHSVCQALVNLSNKDCPMLVSTFYSQHVLPNRPEGSTLELKKTSWKKFGNYLKDKMGQGLLRAGPDSSNKNKKNADSLALLVSFDRKHPDLNGFSKFSDQSSTTGKPTKIVLVNLYVIPPKWVTLLRLNDDDVKAINATSEERRGTGMLTLPEVRAIMDKYIEREDLLSKESNKRGYIVLDGPLTDILYKNSKSGSASSTDYPTHISRKEFAKQIPTKLSPAFALVSMPGSKIVKLAKGSPPKIEIDVSMRQSKKFVTRLRGLERYNIDPVYFSKDVSKRIAIPATIDQDPASSGRAALRQKNDVELVFGGNIVDELEAILCGDESMSSHGGVKDSEYSIPISVIDVTLRKGVPARKKTAGRGQSKKK